MRRIIIIGAGPGGICAGKRLKDSGYDNFTILEQAPGIGGTWWHNSYPGCRCDVPSHLYSFSFAPKLDWSEPYAAQPEILEYLKDCVTRFGLDPHLRLNTRVESARWDDESACWMVRTGNGEQLSADILISAVGLFNLPAYPKIAGLEQFDGILMHSARWDHSQDLTGKTVAVIGSAASAVQLVPEVAKIAGRLDVYQRTPNYISPRETSFSEQYLTQASIDPEPAAAAERARASALLNAIVTLDVPEILEQFIAACANNLAQVEDETLRRKLTPDYPFGSKRGLVSSDWYPTFNRPNVQLVTEPILRITPDSIVARDGTERRIDAIVLATGFDTTKFLSAIPVNGRNGVALNDTWSAGAKAYLGITVSRFPNLFMLYGPNTNNGSIIHQIESQVDYILGKLKMMDAQLLQWIDIKPAAMDSYNAELQEDLASVSVWQHGVNDYYRSESGLIVTQWPHSMDRYQVQTSRLDGDAYETMAMENMEKQSAR